jgi:hypothetical protein
MQNVHTSASSRCGFHHLSFWLGPAHVAGMSDLCRRYSDNILVYTLRKELVGSVSYKNYNYTVENFIIH